jgi:hypothetical protein
MISLLVLSSIENPFSISDLFEVFLHKSLVRGCGVFGLHPIPLFHPDVVRDLFEGFTSHYFVIISGPTHQNWVEQLYKLVSCQVLVILKENFEFLFKFLYILWGRFNEEYSSSWIFPIKIAFKMKTHKIETNSNVRNTSFLFV